MQCTRWGSDYLIPDASDGERQVLALICDLLLNEEPGILFLVDEPEAHLNPALAGRIWEVIETGLPNAQFIYTTHSIPFATRPTVNSLFVMNKATLQPQPIANIDEISEDDLPLFLGAIPLILASKYAIAVEGKDASFDSSFYPWLLTRTDVAVVAGGSKNEVLGETERLALWSNLAPAAKIIGVVDRDHSLVASDSNTVIALDYHEAESYLCDPGVIAAVAAKVLGKDPQTVAPEVRTRILDFAKRNMVKIVGWRGSERLAIRVGASISNSALSKITSIDLLKSAMQSQVSAQLGGATTRLSPARISQVLDEEERALTTALAASDTDSILRLVPGKELLHDLAKLTGLADATTLLAFCRTNLDPRTFSGLKQLRGRILSKLT